MITPGEKKSFCVFSKQNQPEKQMSVSAGSLLLFCLYKTLTQERNE